MKQKVFCPVCKTFWFYADQRKNSYGKPIGPNSAGRLTCDKCLDAMKAVMDDPDTASERQLAKFDRMDEEAEDKA
jgi:hypothetical protein